MALTVFVCEACASSNGYTEEDASDLWSVADCYLCHGMNVRRNEYQLRAYHLKPETDKDTTNEEGKKHATSSDV